MTSTLLEHEECLSLWKEAMDYNTEVDLCAFKRNNLKWLNETRVEKIKYFLNLGHIECSKDTKKRIQKIYMYLALMSYILDAGEQDIHNSRIIIQGLSELIDYMIPDRNELELEQYLYLIIPITWRQNGDDDEDEVKNRCPTNIAVSQRMSIIMSECCICWELAKLSTQCNHTYCETCVYEILKKPDDQGHIYCAMCRSNVTEYRCIQLNVVDNLSNKMKELNDVFNLEEIE